MIVLSYVSIQQLFYFFPLHLNRKPCISVTYTLNPSSFQVGFLHIFQKNTLLKKDGMGYFCLSLFKEES